MNTNQLELNNKEIIRLVVEDRYRAVRYALFLIGTLLIICFTREVTDYPSPYRYYRLACIYVTIVALSLINMNVLVAKLFFRGKYLLYLLFLLLLVFGGLSAVSNLLRVFAQQQQFSLIVSDDKRGLFEGIVILVPIVLVTTMIKLFQRWIRDTQRMAALNNISLSTELTSLKNQINPHFLFNMLNGIKALIRIDPDKAITVIMKLSELLRYQLYENNDTKTPLQSEVEFLNNLLDLEKLRRDNLSVHVIIKNDIKGVNVPPGLFTVFVENAVKHSVAISQKESYIKVEFAMDGGKLYFCCTNSIDSHYKPSQKHKGLGLTNITRRLQLLYEEDYSCNVKATESEYETKLILPI